jgi:hypothetical protein
MKLPKTRASIVICDMNEVPWFLLTIYGATTEDLCTVPGGGNIVAAALKRRGLNMMQDCIASIFDVDVGERTLFHPPMGHRK